MDKTFKNKQTKKPQKTATSQNRKHLLRSRVTLVIWSCNTNYNKIISLAKNKKSDDPEHWN